MINFKTYISENLISSNKHERDVCLDSLKKLIIEKPNVEFCILNPKNSILLRESFSKFQQSLYCVICETNNQTKRYYLAIKKPNISSEIFRENINDCHYETNNFDIFYYGFNKIKTLKNEILTENANIVLSLDLLEEKISNFYGTSFKFVGLEIPKIQKEKQLFIENNLSVFPKIINEIV